MKRIAWFAPVLLLSATSSFAQSDGARSSIGEDRPLSQTVKEDEAQQPALKAPEEAPKVRSDSGKPTPVDEQLPGAVESTQNDRH